MHAVPPPLKRVVEAVAANVDRYAVEAAERVIAARLPMYAAFSAETLAPLLVPGFAGLASDLADGSADGTVAFCRRVSALRASEGADLDDLIRGVGFGYEVVADHIEEVFAGDLEARLFWERRRREISGMGVLALNHAYFTRREEIILAQNAQIRRLSAPILPVANGVLVMPLVGSIDEGRSGQIVETLLARVSQDRAEVVIVDVTGVAHIDTGVAKVIAHAAQAARLLGAHMILVGISPGLAQTVVRMGLAIHGVVMLADLKSGILKALELTGKMIADADKRSR